MYRALAAVTTIAAVAAGAALGTGGGSPSPTPGEPPFAASEGRLVSYASCDDFLDRTRAEALAMTGPWGFTGTAGRLSIAPTAMDEERAMPADSAAPGGTTPDFSGTNVQEAGVDEPDIMKTDGRYMFTVSGSTLYAVDVSGGGAIEAGRLDLADMGGAQVLLSGDRLLVISPGAAPEFTTATDESVPASSVAVPVPQGTLLRLVDVSDPAAMTTVETLRLEGTLVSARLTGRSVRVVLTTPPQIPAMTGPTGSGIVSQTIATIVNRRTLSATDAGDWLPSYAVERNGETSEPRQLVECQDVRHPASFTGLDMLTVVTLDLEQGVTPVDTDAVQTAGQIVYGSPTSIYVATSRWWDGTGDPGHTTTEIHRFDTSAATETVYRGTGKVVGHLLSQWSMSEHDGVLRVASTEDRTWAPDDGVSESQSYVTTLDVGPDRLAPRARVGGLGRGERIYAVRFMGDRGYVVTFRQTDPLYVLDLSNPGHPRVTGELKIPGYSSYLHPVGDGLLLGVGQDATLEGRTQGTQVSLFDVNDPAAPRRVAHTSFPGGWSEAEGDHHAFLYWPANGLTVIPLQGQDPDGTWTTTARGMSVRPGEGIRQVGRLEHPLEAGIRGTIRRSAVIGDTLYTVSEAGIEANDLETLRDRAWAPFS